MLTAATGMRSPILPASWERKATARGIGGESSSPHLLIRVSSCKRTRGQGQVPSTLHEQDVLAFWAGGVRGTRAIGGLASRQMPICSVRRSVRLRRSQRPVVRQCQGRPLTVCWFREERLPASKVRRPKNAPCGVSGAFPILSVGTCIGTSTPGGRLEPWLLELTN